MTDCSLWTQNTKDTGNTGYLALPWAGHAFILTYITNKSKQYVAQIKFMGHLIDTMDTVDINFQANMIVID